MRVVTLFVGVLMTTACNSAAPPDGTPRLSLPKEGAVAFQDGFADASAWEAVDGKWAAKKSGADSVLEQSAVDRVFPRTLLKDKAFTDLDVTVVFRPISGKVDASGGIIFRAQDGDNYYVVRANSLEDNFRLYTVVKGKRTQLAGTTVTPPKLGDKHTLRVVAVGDRMQAYLNGVLLLDHKDATFSSGRVGLWTKADAVTEFSGFTVSGVPAK